jgi:hypothetical protein
MTTDERLDRIRSLIRDVPDFPKPGILFKDICPLLADPAGFTTTLDLLAEAYAGQRVDTIVGIESRGFIFGAALAARMSASFVPARKPGKLPAETDGWSTSSNTAPTRSRCTRTRSSRASASSSWTTSSPPVAPPGPPASSFAVRVPSCSVTAS